MFTREYGVREGLTLWTLICGLFGRPQTTLHHDVSPIHKSLQSHVILVDSPIFTRDVRRPSNLASDDRGNSGPRCLSYPDPPRPLTRSRSHFVLRRLDPSRDSLRHRSRTRPLVFGRRFEVGVISDPLKT